MPTMPANAYALTGFPLCHARPDSVHNPDDFMTRNPGILQPWPKPFLDEGITVANATRLDSDSHPTGARLRNLAFDKFKISARTGDLSSTHL